MPRLIIKGTIINFPESAASPSWAPAVIETVEALTDAVNSISATYDVAPQAQNIDAQNSATNVDLNNLSFPSSDVRAVTIFYSVYRKTEDSGPPDGQEVAESGTLEMTYNNANPITQKWEMSRVFQGDGHITFSVSDQGQVSFTTSALSGVNHVGIVTYRALAVLNV